MSKKTKISWFKVGRKEMDMILKGGLGRRKYTVWAVYIRLLDLVNRNQSTEFEIHAGFIESLTGTSRKHHISMPAAFGGLGVNPTHPE